MGPTVVSHYRILDRLGEGGMGVVYRAEDLRLGREVAIKLLRPDASTPVEWRDRFEREARLASSLQHAHICTIHELGDHDGQPFIAMERLEGQTIRQLIDAGPDPDPPRPRFCPADRGRARCRASPRHHPSRHQARQPVRHLRRPPEGARLRVGQDHRG